MAASGRFFGLEGGTTSGKLKKSRWIPFVLLFLMVALACYVLFSVAQDVRQTTRAQAQSLRTLALQADITAEAFFDQYQSVLRTLQSVPALRQRDTPSCNSLFFDINKSFPEVVNFAAVDANGFFFCSGKPFDLSAPPDISNLEFFIRISQGETRAVMQPHIGPISGEYVTGIAEPLGRGGTSGAFDGLIGVSIHFSALRSRWDRMLLESPNDLLVYSQDGIVFYASGAFASLMEQNGQEISALPEGAWGTYVKNGTSYAFYGIDSKIMNLRIVGLFPEQSSFLNYLRGHKEGVVALLIIFLLMIALLYLLRKEQVWISIISSNEEVLKGIIKNVSYPIIIVESKTQNILFLNAKAIKILGYSVEDVATAEQWWTTVYPDKEYREVVKNAWMHAVQEAERLGTAIAPQEWVMYCKDGEYRDIECTLMPLGEISVVSMIDFTVHRHLERDLVEAKDRAEAANRTKTEFLANMSHEIRTPINGVLGMLQLMQHTELDTNQVEFVRVAISSIKRLTRLLSDILDLSKVEAGRMVLREECFEVGELRNTAWELFQMAAKDKNLRFEVSIDESMPAVLYGDESRLMQILFNLIGNAIKFTSEGSVRVVVSALRAASEECVRVLICVSDTGIGVSNEQLADIFEPFSQADGSFERRYQGAGLGLAIVRRLVKIMGGELAFDSEQGKGSTVYVTLPLRVPVGPVALKPLDHRRRADMTNRQFNVLLVEDDSVSSMAARLLLEKDGHRVTVAGNGREAVDALKKQPFDMVLMDVQMPVLDGVAATRLICSGRAGADRCAVPIVAMTAYSMQGDQERFLAAGMDGYISKPVEMETLKDVMGKVLGSV